MTRSKDLSRRPPQATQRKYQDNKCLDLSQLPHSDLLPKFSHKKSANENPRAWEEWLKWAFISFLGKEQGDMKDRITAPFKDAPLLTAGIGNYRHVTLWVQWIKFTGWIKVAEQVTLRWRDHSELPGGPYVIMSVLEGGCGVQERLRCDVAGFKDGQRGHKSKDVVGLQPPESGKSQERDSPLEPPKSHRARLTPRF